MRNVGSEEHTLAGLQDHVIHQINAPAAHVAGEVTGYTQKKSRQQLVLSFTSYRTFRSIETVGNCNLCEMKKKLTQRSDTLLEPLKRRGDLVIGASHQRREARLQSLLFLGLRLGLGQQLARISPKDAGKLFNFCRNNENLSAFRSYLSPGDQAKTDKCYHFCST